MVKQELEWKKQIINLKIPNIHSITPYILNEKWYIIKDRYLNEIKSINKENNFFSNNILKNAENYGHWSCLVYGIAEDEETLLNICTWVTILFQLDDNGVDSNFNYIDYFLDIIKDNKFINKNVIKIYENTIGNDKFTERLKESFDKWFLSVKEEDKYRNLGFNDIQDYLYFRIENSCIRPLMIIVEKSIHVDVENKINIGNEIYNSNSLLFLLLGHLILVSDMYGLKREFYKKDWINWIFINSKNNKISLQESINMTEKLIHEYEKKFLNKCDEIILKFNYDIKIHKYILALKVFLSGNLEWCKKCNRYQNVDIS